MPCISSSHLAFHLGEETSTVNVRISAFCCQRRALIRVLTSGVCVFVLFLFELHHHFPASIYDHLGLAPLVFTGYSKCLLLILHPSVSNFI